MSRESKRVLKLCSRCGWMGLFVLFCGLTGITQSRLRTENVILITADGLRHEELFAGMDENLLAEDNVELKTQYWRTTDKERRRALMPFFWDTLAPEGIVLGNRAGGSEVKVANPYWFSYPGYAEILTGQVLEEVTSNDSVRISRETVLEFVKRQLQLQTSQVASFASWSVFNFITAHREGAIFSNAGYQDVPERWSTSRLLELNQLQKEMLTPWKDVRHDAITFWMALEYLKTHRPRLLYLALGETDDWAHDGRYDRVLEIIREFDRYLEILWQTLQSIQQYREKTTLVITSDHGRGPGREDWTSHGKKIPGAEYIWLAVVGPDTPNRGEVSPSPTFYQKQVAATVLRFLGLHQEDFDSQAAPPVPLAFQGIR